MLGICCASLVGCGAGSDTGCVSGQACTRILFIGDSYTSVNDLPGTLSSLAASGAHRIETQALDAGGATLADHVSDPNTVTTINSMSWNYVVLQEQSQIPSVESLRQSEMYPAADQLVTDIRADKATPLFYLPWTREAGWPEDGIPNYDQMQQAVNDGYLTIANRESVAIAPVGPAWQYALTQYTSSDLWQSDGIHPTVKGTYLAACVFYAAIYRQTPVGLSYHASLSDADAAKLQSIAAGTVLSNPGNWGLK